MLRLIAITSLYWLAVKDGGKAPAPSALSRESLREPVDFIRDRPASGLFITRQSASFSCFPKYWFMESTTSAGSHVGREQAVIVLWEPFTMTFGFKRVRSFKHTG